MLSRRAGLSATAELSCTTYIRPFSDACVITEQCRNTVTMQVTNFHRSRFSCIGGRILSKGDCSCYAYIVKSWEAGRTSKGIRLQQYYNGLPMKNLSGFNFNFNQPNVYGTSDLKNKTFMIKKALLYCIRRVIYIGRPFNFLFRCFASV